MRRHRLGLFVFLASLTVPCAARALVPAPLPPPEAIASGGRIDPKRATDAYLARVSPADRQRSNAYFEGGYWLLLWNFLFSTAVALFLLSSGTSRRFRDFAQRKLRWSPLRTGLYWVIYLVTTTLLTFPLTVYESFFRERKYGLMNQSFGAWLKERGIELALGVVFGGILMMVLYGVLRRAPRTWWLWGALTAILFLMIGEILGPVYIAPLFNKYTRLSDPAIREPILTLARSEGIDANDIWVMDASRQSKRVSANVSGFLGTERITLNDNLLARCSNEEVQAVMGHEMGHYVLHHVYKGILFFGVVIVVGFAMVRLVFNRLVITRGVRWGVEGVGDLAGLPLLFLLVSAYFFVLTPVLNTYIRTEEAEADLFGINAARQPDGEAEVDLKLGEYRKLDPGKLEEFLFFDHPAGRSRILMAMRWKAEQAARP